MDVNYYVNEALHVPLIQLNLLFWICCLVALIVFPLVLRFGINKEAKANKQVIEAIKENPNEKPSPELKKSANKGTALIFLAILLLTGSVIWTLLDYNQREQDSYSLALSAYVTAAQAGEKEEGQFFSQTELENKFPELINLNKFDIEYSNFENGVLIQATKASSYGNQTCDVTYKNKLLFWKGRLCNSEILRELDASSEFSDDIK